MRVISGNNRGRRMVAPTGLETRPATARVRASIFSRICSRVDLHGARVLDLFAGSGSLGIESLSRGASHVIFVDSSRRAIRTIHRNLEQLEILSQAELIGTSYEKALIALNCRGARFDLVFVDPPFAFDCAEEVLAKLVRLDLLKLHGILMLRRFHRARALALDGLDCVSEARLGDHLIALYRRADQAAVTVGARPHGE